MSWYKIFFVIIVVSLIFFGAQKIKIHDKIVNPEIVEVPTSKDSIDLAFAGDIMLDRGVKSSVIKNFALDYQQLFTNLTQLKDSDILFANLEGPASDKGKNVGSIYSFRMDPIVIPILKGVGFDVLSVANNHVGDWTRDAYVDTLTGLKNSGILYAGGGLNSSEAELPVVIEKNGIKVGFLAFSDVGPNWMKATENESGLLLASNPRFDEIIKSAAKQVDHLVVSFHFGEEYKTKHNSRQEYLAHSAIDAGAKIIVGHHPHVVQDFEVYRQSYIAYSLGNFIFDQPFSKNTMQGMLLNIKLNKDGTMQVRKDVTKLNKFFQVEEAVKGEEEKIEFERAETVNDSRTYELGKKIIGYWAQDSSESSPDGECSPDKYEISFSVEENEQIFASWLHCRPNESGTWRINPNNDTVIINLKNENNDMIGSLSDDEKSVAFEDEDGLFKRENSPTIDKEVQASLDAWDLLNKK